MKQFNLSMDTLDLLYNLKCNLCKSSSVKDRKEVLKTITDDSLKELLKLTYDSNIKFSVTSTNVKKYKKPVNEPLVPWELFKLLNSLAKREITGHSAIDAIISFTKPLNKHQEEVFFNVLDKDLKASINTKIINGAIPLLIPEFSVALGKDYDPKYTEKGKWLISRKYDGIRCIVFIQGGKVSYYSRTGKQLYSLNNLTPELSQLPDCVLDGEITQNSDLEDFQKLMKEIHKKNFQLTNVIFNVFDVLTNDEFWSGKSTDNLTTRLSRLSCETTHISKVKQVEFTPETFAEYTELFKKAKWEGLIVRKNIGYKGKRSNDILKVKQFFTEEYTVVGIETGTMRIYDASVKNYIHQQLLTAITINHKGVSVRVGSGFSVNERLSFYNNPELIVNKLVWKFEIPNL
jgi:DNA ligase-1